MIVMKWAVENPGLYWIVSPTYKQTKQIHWNEIQKEIPGSWIVKKNEVDLSLHLHNGSVIELKGAENPDNLRGVKLKGLVFDEIAAIRHWNWLWEEVLRPTLSDYIAPALFISTPQGFNHFYELFQKGAKSSEYKSWQFKTTDNPYISKTEVKSAQDDLTEDAFYQEYMAEFRQYTGLVYKVFDRETHIKAMPEDIEPVYYLRGLDRGFRNPSAVPIIAVTKDDVWYQIDEIYESQLTTPELFDRIKEKSREHSIEEYEYSTADSAQAGDIQELSDLGEDFVPVEKVSQQTSLNYVRYKIERLTQRIKSGGYFVDPKCEHTIKEFETYRWKEHKDQTKEQPDTPEKQNDHMLDALGDLNSMYEYYYKLKKKNPWDDKIPGTYVPPSPVKEEQEDELLLEAEQDTYWS
jgi:phage terminase large subunit